MLPLTLTAPNCLGSFLLIAKGLARTTRHRLGRESAKLSNLHAPGDLPWHFGCSRLFVACLH
jgi:hypothetical protein